MDPEGKQQVTVRLWPLSPVGWFGLVGVATLVDILILVKWISLLFSGPITSHPNPNVPGPPFELIDLFGRFIGLLLLLLVGGCPVLIALVAVWRRWKNAGMRQRNYWVWTSIEGSVVALKFLLLFYTIFVPVHNFALLVSNLVWLTHTIAIPYKLDNRTETGAPRQETP